jgi:nitrite reductase (NO-forming)/hydroxylamine reductase
MYWEIVMRMKKLALSIMPLAGLLIVACSQQADQGNARVVGGTDASTAAVGATETNELMAAGERIYLANCAACHLPTGAGLAGAFPPLAGSDFLRGNRQEVLAAALFGLQGRITVNGVEYNGVMPSFGHLPDADLAAAITYVFGSWGNNLAPVSAAEVAAVRAKL